MKSMLVCQEEKSWLGKEELRVCWFVRKRRVGYAKNKSNNCFNRTLLLSRNLLSRFARQVSRQLTQCRLSKCWADAPEAHQTTDYSKRAPSVALSFIEENPKK